MRAFDDLLSASGDLISLAEPLQNVEASHDLRRLRSHLVFPRRKAGIVEEAPYRHGA
jgi:hypothetical protein